MSINSITLSKVDKICDYLPVISTISNLTDIFLKNVIPPASEDGLSLITKSEKDGHANLLFDRHYTHLHNKSYARCVILLIPVIGNLIIGIYDFSQRKFSNKELFLKDIKHNARQLQHASEELRADKDVVLAALNNADKELPSYDLNYTGYLLQFASEALRNDRDIVLAAVRKSGGALKFASKELRGDREIVSATIKENGCWGFNYASKELRSDRDLVLAAASKTHFTLEFVNPKLRDDKEVVQVALKHYPAGFKFASERLKSDPEVLRAALEGMHPDLFQQPTSDSNNP